MQFSYQYILVLGSNLGDKKQNITQAITLLKENGQVVLREGDFLFTEPAIEKNQPDFINKGILCCSSLSPEDLLQLVKNIEIKLERSTTYRFGPREIDIDIVWWSIGEYHSEKLQIPHKENNSRSWIRNILAELIPANLAQSLYYKSMNVETVKTCLDFQQKKNNRQKIVMLTAYDFSMARILARTSVDALLVGDSLSNVIQGNDSTLKATIDQMIYHGKAVRKAAPDKFLIIDMPFLSYQISAGEAVSNAGKIIQETGANAVKLEGGIEFIDVVTHIIRSGIPVMGHLGLMPQSILIHGKPSLQAKDENSKQKLLEDAKALQAAGVFGLVVEMIPAELGNKISQSLEIPVIGIGAGSDTDGQVLVIHDLLGFNSDFSPKFVRKYLDFQSDAMKAIENFSKDVREKNFPSRDESFYST